MNKQKRAWNLAEKLEALQHLTKEGISKACRQLGLWGSRCKRADFVKQVGAFNRFIIGLLKGLFCLE